MSQPTKATSHYSPVSSSLSMGIERLKSQKIWVAWRTETAKGRLTKLPYCANGRAKASSTAPGTWATYDDAVKGAARLRDGAEGPFGVGVVLGQVVTTRREAVIHGEFRLIGVDLDSCFDPASERLTPEAQDVVEKFGSYAEISPSGRGVKIFALLREADAGRLDELLKGKRGATFSRGAHDEIALSLGDRYFATTFDVLPGFDRLRAASLETVRWLIDVAGPRFAGQRRSAERDAPKRDRRSGRDDSRSGVAFRLAMRLREEGKNEDDFIAALESDDDLAPWASDDRQVERAWQRAGEIVAESDSFNKSHAVVSVEGKTRIVELATLTFSTESDFHAFYRNRTIPNNGPGVMLASHAWMGSANRRTYKGVVFDPSGRAPADKLNLWRGWARQPKGDECGCRLILRHIREIWADGDAELADYLIGWLAHLLQKPEHKPGTALVLRGEKGSGKDILIATVLRPILGGLYVKVDKPDQLTARFNGQFATALLAHVEESFWAGDPSKKGVLQSLITSETMALEKKGIDVVMVDSFVRLVMTTNEDWAVPATHDERRYCVCNVSDARRGDRDYFDALMREIQRGGVEAFMAFLTDFALSDFDARRVPQTVALTDQKIETLHGVEAWWREVLQHGRLPGGDGDWREDRIEAPRDELRDVFNEWVREDRRRGREASPETFGKALRKMVGAMKNIRPHRGARRYQFPPLQDCRDSFEIFIGGELEW